MKILIDECLPVALADHLTSLGHECNNVRQAGLGSKKNGELLALGRGPVGCDADERSPYQASAEYGRTAPLDYRPVREIESHEGFVVPHTALCSGFAIDRSGQYRRGRVGIDRQNEPPKRKDIV